MKIPTIVNFDEVLQLVARSIQGVMPPGFKFVLIVVSPSNDVKLINNCDDPRHAADLVRHVHEGARKPALKLVTP